MFSSFLELGIETAYKNSEIAKRRACYCNHGIDSNKFFDSSSGYAGYSSIVSSNFSPNFSPNFNSNAKAILFGEDLSKIIERYA